MKSTNSFQLPTTAETGSNDLTRICRGVRGV